VTECLRDLLKISACRQNSCGTYQATNLENQGEECRKVDQRERAKKEPARTQAVLSASPAIEEPMDRDSRFPAHDRAIICLGGAVFDVGRSRDPGAVSATEKAASHLNAVADDAALAMLANGSDRLDRTFEAVESVPRAGSNDFKALVVIVSANFALCHGNLHRTLKQDSQRRHVH
jgi:hypothetical protein